MNQSDLVSYGFRPFARIKWQEPMMEIVVYEPEIAISTEALYAFLVGSEVARLGRFRGRVIVRVRHRAKIVSRCLSGNGIAKGDTFTEKEAEGWRTRLNAARETLQQAGADDATIVGRVFAVSGHITVPPDGPRNAYDAEGAIFRRHGRPPCNMTNR
ncbi:MAG TPA: hypothetical protein VMU69_12730 [Bradyrhizobium sp.]|nr:hypothetical protein [Bradyrhizobium sp.]